MDFLKKTKDDYRGIFNLIEPNLSRIAYNGTKLKINKQRRICAKRQQHRNLLTTNTIKANNKNPKHTIA